MAKEKYIPMLKQHWLKCDVEPKIIEQHHNYHSNVKVVYPELK